jgi:uncharacterized glyoxalase superfamily protein PhnB
MVRPIPEGAHSVIPHLIIRGAAKAMDFYKEAFGAVEQRRATMPGSEQILHAEIRIGDSLVYLGDEFAEMGVRSPHALKGTPVHIHLWVTDVDEAFERAVRAGAQVRMPLMDQFWGDRYGQVEDPFGHYWSMGTHVADYTPEEMDARMREAMANMPPPAPPKRKAVAKKRKAARPKPAAKKAGKARSARHK